MAGKLLITEAIALTEKKMDMSLDDIIKMSKKNTSRVKRPPRVSNKSQGFQNVIASQRNSKIKKFMESRSSIRQGVLAKRRTNFQANQFQLTNEVARNAAVAPMRNRVNHKPRSSCGVPRGAQWSNSPQGSYHMECEGSGKSLSWTLMFDKESTLSPGS